MLLVPAACSTPASNIADFSQELYTPTYASGFTITGAEGKESSLITITNPWQGADSISTRLYIARNGESAPADFDGQVLTGNAKRIVTMSSTHVAMIDAIGATNSIVGVSGLKFISNATVQAHRDSIGDVGYDGNIDYELLLSLNPDIVLLYGVNGASAMESKLKELGIAYMYVGDYLEESPLGKAEWMIAIAELLGCRNTGETTFHAISDNYNRLRATIKSTANDSRPLVMLNTPYGDSWFMPPVKSYMAQLIADAGGRYIYDKNTGNSSMPIDMEEAYMLTSQADVWLNVGVAGSLSDLQSQCPKFADVKSIANRRVYNNTNRLTTSGGNDFYESAIVHPDLLLKDLIMIMHPEVELSGFTYYKQLQ
jgi:iron complex transport system substrate-binding protein